MDIICKRHCCCFQVGGYLLKKKQKKTLHLVFPRESSLGFSMKGQNKKNSPVKLFCGEKSIIDLIGMDKLVQDDRKTTVAQISILETGRVQMKLSEITTGLNGNQMCHNSIRPHQTHLCQIRT